MLMEIKPGVYVSDEDINLTLTDGRLTLLLAKGREVSEIEARRLGVLKTDQAVGPTEFKTEPAGESATSAVTAETPAVPADEPAVGDQVLPIGSNATNPRARKTLK